MAKGTRFAGEVCIFLAGLVVGILVSIHGLAPAITGDRVHAMFLFEPWVYLGVGGGLVACGALLRKVAERL